MDAFPSKSFMREAQEHSVTSGRKRECRCNYCSSLIPRETPPCSFDSPQSRQGSRGSADTVRDVRGFAVKFYMDEGNWDIVGNNIPVLTGSSCCHTTLEFLIYQSSSSLLPPSS
ncbi:hypothetical protein V1520DRAFT_21227 [Lipomyces starkeyi]|uniref:catalase n=1 Tax=Lipomyces starkeyi NRRL Y-11557 TaxID=675824 RepID=A0A1E3QA17_LIPST|nr:hypothetical protein LIPSTDRAFT_276704 [Lipomyces starkeyi NRRL Y-11557]